MMARPSWQGIDEKGLTIPAGNKNGKGSDANLITLLKKVNCKKKNFGNDNLKKLIVSALFVCDYSYIRH